MASINKLKFFVLINFTCYAFLVVSRTVVSINLKK